MEAQTVKESSVKNNQSVKRTLPLCDYTNGKVCRIQTQVENPHAFHKRNDSIGSRNELVPTGTARKFAHEERDEREHQNSKNKDSDSKISTVAEICYFDRLPPEIMEIIFSNLADRDGEYNGNLRLVCRSWYDLCSSKKFLRFSEETRILGTSTFFENCGYEQLHLIFEDTTINAIRDLPVNIWEKFGPKLRSLRFLRCSLEDRIMKNVILYCDNLKHLCLNLETKDNVNTLFCSSQTLGALDVVRPKLESLEIRSTAPYRGVCTREWSIIFNDLIRLFPNIIHFTFAHDYDFKQHVNMMPHPPFELKFSKQLEEVDASSLSMCLAYLMSNDVKEWKKALYEMDKLRLTDVSFNVETNQFKEIRIELLSFFTNQKTLKLVHINLRDFKSTVSEDTLTSTFLAIIYNSPDLRKLKFTSSHSYSNWLKNILLSADLSKLDYFRSGPILVHPRSMEFSYCKFYPGEDPFNWLSKFSYIQHLTLPNYASDKFLQSVFQHMTSLKSLKMCLDICNHVYALTGRYDETQTSPIVGYSIKRLRNLEKLEIHGTMEVSLTGIIKKNGDAIFNEFDFPKLRYLCCFAPKKSSTYINIAQKMPSLTELVFHHSSRVPLKAIVELAQQKKYLHTLRLPEKEHFDQSGMKMIFDVCPSLRFLHTQYHVDFYEPLTKEVRQVRLPVWQNPKPELFE